MSEAPDGRDSENNWVIPSAESLAVETVGAAQGGAEETVGAAHGGAEETVGAAQGGAEEAAPAGSGLAPPPDSQETAQLAHVKPGTEPIEGPAAQEEPKKPDEVQGPPPATEGPSTARGDLEEVSCSSSEDDVEGLRKRVGWGAPLPLSVGPNIREAAQQDADAGSSFNLSTLIIAVIGLLCISILVFSGGSFNSDEDPTQTVMSRSVKGEDPQPPQVISELQEWIKQHADQFSGDSSSLQVMSRLLDKVAKENQEIRHMEAKLQAQKEELEAMLSVTDGEKVTPAPQRPGLTEENVRLKDALLKEETAHLSAKEELQNLQEKLEVLESSHEEKEALMVEKAQLKVDLDAFRSQIEGFLSQKETLVAESQMLRQELDKQRLLVSSIRQDLENLVTKTTEGEEKLLQERLSEMSSRLAMEAQRSETWEKTYVEHAQRRKELVGELRRDHGHKEWKKADKYSKTSDTSTPGGDFRKTHYKHGKEHGKRSTEKSQWESQHEEWRSKKHEHWKDKKHQHSEGEKAKIPEERETWKNKAKEPRSKDPAHHRHDGPERQVRHYHGEAVDGFHPRKGQKEFTDRHKRQKDAEKGKEHRHHDHNKFWKKLSDHQYRVPMGCSGLEDCARKDGMDLFNVELKPVQRAQFEEVLLNFLAKTQLSERLPELTPLLDGFFEGPLFSHQKIRFKDFVDDVEDFLEDLARKETGNDDIVDDFERFVYTSFFGEAATKKRYAKKDKKQKTNKYDKPSGKLEKTYDNGINQSDDRHSIDNSSSPDHHVDSYNFKSMKKHKTHEKHKPWSPDIHYKEESEHKHENEDKHNPKSHNEETGGSFYHHGHHSEKKSKYPHTKPGEEARGHHHNGRHLHKQYKEHQEYWLKQHKGKHNSNPKNPGHQNPYKKQKSPEESFGKDSDKYKHKNPDKYKEDVEHKHHSDKHEKDANNKRYQSRHESHHYWSSVHKPSRDGDHRQPDHHGEDNKRRDDHHKHGEPEDSPRNHHQMNGKDQHKNYHQKYELDKERDRNYRNKKDHHKHGDDIDGEYHQKYNKAHPKKDRGGEYHHKYDKDHHKYDKNHHKHENDRDGEYHKYIKDDYKHEDVRDGEYQHKYDKDHHKHDRDGENHKYNKDHYKHEDVRDGEYQHKYDKDHHKHDRDGEYQHKYDKDHHKHDRDGEYQHKYDKDHHKHDRDGEYQHKYDKDHHKHDGEYHHKYDKDHHKHENDRDGKYHSKYDKDHHKHGGDRNREYQKYKYSKDKHNEER